MLSHWWLGPCRVGDGLGCDGLGWFFLVMPLHVGDSLGLFHGYCGGSCLVKVDGTDFWICEPKPFAKDFYSHKFTKTGLQYEVGVCIQTGLIVSINGPFAAGKYNDITIFRSKMISKLLDWEMVEVDQGYVGQPNKIHVKYELGVSEKASLKQRRGQGQEGRQSMEGSKIFAYLWIDIGIRSQCTAMCFVLLLF